MQRPGLRQSSLSSRHRPWGARFGGAALLVVLSAAGCSKSKDEQTNQAAPAASKPAAVERAPKALYLPDADAPGTRIDNLEATAPPVSLSFSRCPPDMVDVGGRFCIDRYEATLVDARSGRALSPYYHPTRGKTRTTYEQWQRLRLEVGSEPARRMPLPEPPVWQLTEAFEPRAASVRGVVPNGYLSGHVAAQACRNAGKRLCLPEEWVTACRGFQGRKYPYGDEYRPGVCNVFRETHPAAKLHDDASRGHHDPRLNQVDEAGEPLLRVTGATASCRSEWGTDAAYDMVGNLDEWVDEPAGAFVGGFYSRGTKEGCDARIASHPPQYFDYSLGVRCCR